MIRRNLRLPASGAYSSLTKGRTSMALSYPKLPATSLSFSPKISQKNFPFKPAVCSSSFSSSSLSSSSFSLFNPSPSNEMAPLTVDKLNEHVVNAKYAVRGRLALRAEELREQLKANPGSLPFKKVVNANIGNPQQLDQNPITFYRQVLALVQYPDLLKNPDSELLFKKDAIERAKFLINEIGSVGAYSHSKGIPAVRKSVAKFIEQRDGFPSDPERIYLCAGASIGVTQLLSALSTGPTSGFLIPIPQYPLYSATLTLVNSTAVQYHLDEKKGWATNVDEVRSIVNAAKLQNIDLKSIVVINPGNPTGAILSEQNIRDIIDVAADDHLVIIADEVYQANVFVGEFISFKKVLRQLQQENPGSKYDSVQLASIHSTSKGMIGECGQRGGYMELTGFHPEVEEHIYKLASIALCPVVTGQVLTELMVNPPAPGGDSYETFISEYNGIFNTLKHRANNLYQAFKQMEGVEVQEPQGAMYLFPRITIPQKAIDAAKEVNEVADEFYCLQLLERTGICVIPGSGFGQQEGTWHFRTTFLAPGDDYAIDLVNFHKVFMDKYRD